MFPRRLDDWNTIKAPDARYVLIVLGTKSHLEVIGISNYFFHQK